VNSKPTLEKAYKNLSFLNSPEARSIRILSEFIEPQARFNQLDIQSTVVFFGSARIKPKQTSKSALKKLVQFARENPSAENEKQLAAARLQVRLSAYYEKAAQLAQMLTEWAMENAAENKQKIYICSGGGPGIMEAANKGASKAGGKSIGLNISIPTEQFANPYITDELSFEFHYFFMRKFWFAYLAKALVIFPGGFGTLDEFMEVLTLIQTQKIKKEIPIIVFGQEYWDDVINIEAMARWGAISEDDLKYFHFVNDAEEGFKIIKEKLEKTKEE
jgi:uncharacterized protein (TIGR00730 family)